MPTFNLVEEPWIRCIPSSGGGLLTLNLRETLNQAHALREITDDSPLVVVALHRLLLAIAHRVYRGPATVAEWRAIRDAGQFDADRVNAYLATWRHRFDLFDAERPFYQTPALPGVDTSSVAKLAHEKASGNNITLFDHTTPDTGAMTPAQAARYLVAFQAYAIGGGVSEPFNLSDAPLARDYTVLVRGRSLFETLLFNLGHYDRERPIGWLGADDPPCWEQVSQRMPVKEGTPPNGYLDYLTWQSRRVHLVYDADSGLIRDCQIRQNLKLAMDARDPFKAYGQSKERGVYSRRLSEQRAVWRDSHALIDTVQESSYRPAIFDWLAEAVSASIGRSRGQVRQSEFDVLGFLNEGARATVILWRRDHLPLPLNYLTSLELRNRLNEGLRHAEEVARLLTPTLVKSGGRGEEPTQRPLYVLAKEVLRGGGLHGVTHEREVKQTTVDAFAKRFDTERIYWAGLEPHFRRFMIRLAERMELGGQTEAARSLFEWSRDVESCAREAFQLTLSGLELSGRTARARAMAEHAFNWQLHSALRTAHALWGVSADSANESSDIKELPYESTQGAEV